jgi:nitric oxide synthase-interacting protein
MTRHSKNATAGPTYTYHEKNKDSKQSGYGSQDVRLNKDAIKEFDCCSLTLQPCKDPVITSDGYLYDKEAILEYILHQKAENARKMKKYEQYKNKEDKDLKELAEIEEKEKLKKFMKIEGKFVQQSSKDEKKEATTSSVSNMSGDRNTKLPSFWVPCLVPNAETPNAPVKKPDNKVYCPMSGNPIALKDLITVKFKLMDEKDTSSLISKKERYICAVSDDILNNSTQCVVLKPS